MAEEIKKTEEITFRGLPLGTKKKIKAAAKARDKTTMTHLFRGWLEKLKVI